MTDKIKSSINYLNLLPICIALIILLLFVLVLLQIKADFEKDHYKKGFEQTDGYTAKDCPNIIDYLQIQYNQHNMNDRDYWNYLEYTWQKVKSIGCTGLPPHLDLKMNP